MHAQFASRKSPQKQHALHTYAFDGQCRIWKSTSPRECSRILLILHSILEQKWKKNKTDFKMRKTTTPMWANKNGLHLLREVVCLRVLNIYYISAIFYSILKAEEHCIGHKRSERENHIKTKRQTAWSFYSQKKCMIKINRKTERSKALFSVRSLFGERQRTKTKYEEKWEPTKNNATDQATEKWPVWIRSSIDAKRNRL